MTIQRKPFKFNLDDFETKENGTCYLGEFLIYIQFANFERYHTELGYFHNSHIAYGDYYESHTEFVYNDGSGLKTITIFFDYLPLIGEQEI